MRVHLLNWQFQPKRWSRSWQASIALARTAIDGVLEDNPCLGNHPAQHVARATTTGPRPAAIETGLPEATFPKDCPSTAEEIFWDDFSPESAA